jgi:hypothetical protein
MMSQLVLAVIVDGLHAGLVLPVQGWDGEVEVEGVRYRLALRAEDGTVGVYTRLGRGVDILRGWPTVRSVWRNEPRDEGV